MAQVSRRTRITRVFLGAVLAASVVVGGYALKNMPSKDTILLGSAGSTPTSSDAEAGKTQAGSRPDRNDALDGAVVHPPTVTSGSDNGKDQGTLYALIISLITSITSVLGLLMSKYTEWQRSRLEQMKLAIELQQKELELQEMRRKLQDA